jgi:hypothetical protein
MGVGLTLMTMNNLGEIPPEWNVPIVSLPSAINPVDFDHVLDEVMHSLSPDAHGDIRKEG